MSIEYLPVGIACNLKCNYCYQDPMRDAGNVSAPRDWSAARRLLEAHNYNFTVFGGEPLLTPIEHLEEVFRFGYEKFGRNGIQTNGTLLESAHIELFKRYNVGVGISCDGPGSLSDSRWMGSLEETRTATDRTVEAIRRLCEAKIFPSIIVTITKSNWSESFHDFLNTLETWGVKHVNFHILETESGRERLTDEQNIKAFTSIYEYSEGSKLKINPFEDIRKLLTETDPSVSCIWNHCDPATTAAVQGVTPDGIQSNCGRTNKDGVNWVKADRPGFERYLLLHQVPQEYGGCKDCRFFVFCKGQCPGTAIDSDWRNRTADCRVWYTLFELVERSIVHELRLPISRDSARLKVMENQLLASWQGSSGATNHHGDSPHGDSPHGDAHGDQPHGDSHGDSNVGVEVTWV